MKQDPLTARAITAELDKLEKLEAIANKYDEALEEHPESELIMEMFDKAYMREWEQFDRVAKIIAAYAATDEKTARTLLKSKRDELRKIF